VTAWPWLAIEEDMTRSEAVTTPVGRAVVTLHGLGRSRDHMAGLGTFLEKNGDYTWINVGYASTRGSIDDHAAALASVLAGLEGVESIDLVCHSLGNLVVRRYLAEANEPRPRFQPDSRLHRMVMLGPPNNGARLAHVLADLLRDNEVARLIAGPSAWQLAREWDDASQHLATPPFPFAIVAGGTGTERGLNPLVEGDDDMIVAVDETRLAGAADFRLVPCRHGHLMNNEAVRQYVRSFLTTGAFTTEAERQPIPLPAATAANAPAQRPPHAP
jgi:pimeloyl-ACP methyl ester carboxylesterase